MGVLVACGAALAAQPPARIAIIVGQNAPQTEGLPTLHYADDDAIRYDQLFEMLGFKTHLLVVMDDETHRRHPASGAQARVPSLPELRAAFETANREIDAAHAAGTRADLFFVYAGHGERSADGEGLLHLEGGRLARRDLIELLRASKADFNHVIIDACHASALVFRRGASDGFSEVSFDGAVERYLAKEDIRTLPNTGVLLAASSSEETHEWSAIGAGVFSHQVRSALSGAADVNRDGFIEYSEVAAYVASANATLRVASARPSVVATAPPLDRNRALVDVQEGHAAYLRLPAGWAKRAWLEDQTGERYVDLHPSGEAPVRLALAADRRWYLRTAERELPILVAQGRVAAPDFGEWRVRSAQARGAVDSTYHADLFAQPFGAAFYQGWVSQSGAPAARRQRDLVALDRIESETSLAPYAWSFAGVAVAAGVAAIVTGRMADDEFNGFVNELAQTGQDDPSRRQRINSLKGWTNGLLIGALATGVLSGTLFWLDREPQLMPYAGPGGFGIGGLF